MLHRRRLLAAGVGLGATGLSRATPAQTPGPLRLVVPFPAGGPTDALARILADEMKAAFGRPFIVENKPGASGAIGTRYFLGLPASSASFLVGNIQTHATAPFLIKDAGYDPLADFTPVVGLVDIHHVLVTRSDLRVADLPELVELAKGAPAKLNYGSTGIGSGSHLAMELLMARTGTRMQHVPYQGATQMAGEIAAGRLDLALAILPAVKTLIDGGLIKALALAGSNRAVQLPTVPTLSEQGIMDAEAESWLALFVRRSGTGDHTGPIDMGIIVRERLARDDVKARIEKLGLNLALRSGTQFRDFQNAEIARWGAIIRNISLQPE